MNEMHRGEEEAVDAEEIITISFLLMFFFYLFLRLNNRNNRNCQDNLGNILKGASCLHWHSNLAGTPWLYG